MAASVCSDTENCNDKLKRVTEEMWQQAQESQVGQLLDLPHCTRPCFTQHWHRPRYSIYYSKSIDFHALHYGSCELTLQTMRACPLTCTHPQSLMMMALLVSSTTQLMETSLLSCLQFTGI